MKMTTATATTLRRTPQASRFLLLHPLSWVVASPPPGWSESHPSAFTSRPFLGLVKSLLPTWSTWQIPWVLLDPVQVPTPLWRPLWFPSCISPLHTMRWAPCSLCHGTLQTPQSGVLIILHCNYSSSKWLSTGHEHLWAHRLGLGHLVCLAFCGVWYIANVH